MQAEEKEERPQCHACVLAGTKCPGYEKRWKFMDENSRLLSIYRKKNYVLEEILREADTSLNCTHPSPYSDFPTLSEPAARRIFRVDIFRSISSPEDGNASFLAQILKDPRFQSLLPLRSNGNFFAFIPSHIGRNLALDDAISCLSSIYKDTFATSSKPSEITFRRYARSLNSLRVCLEEPLVRLQSETICASLILQCCELTLNTDEGQWSNLLRGSKLLIQESGPSRFKTSFERGMLESQRHLFIAQDINACEKCFLSRPEWRQLTGSLATTGAQIPRSCGLLQTRFTDILMDVPDLFYSVIKLSEQEKARCIDMTVIKTRALRVLRQVVTMQGTIQNWYDDDFEPVLRKASGEFQDDFDNDGCHRGYPNVFLAVLDCTSNSILLHVEALLSKLATLFPRETQLLKPDTPIGCAVARQAIVHSAFVYVKKSSKVAWKPLEFGLKQLQTLDDVINHIFESGLSK
ncbi:uncharacterized protein A1O9_11743 [Exophiala aquamarina CBS 119918]|uniref:Zn(2)-C6 fungal-type domain-containing protein n=1 Tax=Exophiala aquamarina CBS 119918 TaxID=1182545 RepID=A0A072NXF9_9EURO|nr:uncharacterized protein A1O9_11743 [Exophiala aquamarina CBS 119918]KEF52117.1 hypothetical protein A1O9_11743 [Exophiala aquamarina CBS 119918]